MTYNLFFIQFVIIQPYFLLFVLAYSICPHGWAQHGESCYHVSSEPANWIDAMVYIHIHKSVTNRNKQQISHLQNVSEVRNTCI